MTQTPASQEIVTPHLRTPVAGSGPRFNVELVAWVTTAGIAALWRIPHLGALPPAPGEALRAASAWHFGRGTVDGHWTGELSAALAAIALRLDGNALGWARFPSAAAGVLAVLLLALFRPYAGRATPLIAALLLATSPIAVAASRTTGPDSLALVCGLLITWLVLRITERGNRSNLMSLGAVAGVALGTGAVAVAVALLAALWAVVEVVWMRRTDAATRWAQVLHDRRAWRAALLLALPGLALAVVRYGAGPDRAALAALRDWSRTFPGESLPWHAPLSLLLWYEPLSLVLGLAGTGALLIVAYRCGASALSPFERLLLMQAAGGLVLSMMVLHQRAGLLLTFTAPLLLLAAAITVRSLPSLSLLSWQDSGRILLAVPFILGYIVLQLLSWARAGQAPRGEVLAALLLLAVAVALSGFAAGAAPRAIPGLLILSTWLLMGWVAPHGASAVAFHWGDEPVRGVTPLNTRSEVVQAAEQALQVSRPVAIEQPLADALAWELRARAVRRYVGLPPPGVIAIMRDQTERPPGATVVAGPAEVTRRWYPRGGDGIGIIRWLMHREAWGGIDATHAVVVRIP